MQFIKLFNGIGIYPVDIEIDPTGFVHGRCPRGSSCCAVVFQLKLVEKEKERARSKERKEMLNGAST